MIAARRRSTGRRLLTDRLGTVVATLCVGLALIPLAAVIGFVIEKGGGAITWDFFVKNPPPQFLGQAGGGMFPMIIGTLEIVACTAVIGIPLGVLSGIFLATAGKGRFPQSVRFGCDVIAGIPSILAGLMVYVLVILPTQTYSALAASIALVVLMFPTVTRATEAAIEAVPPELSEAALGLGAPEWKTVLRVTIPTAAAGIVTAIILGIARVAGETAPLVFTLGGVAQSTNFNPFHGPMPSLPLQIFTDTQSGFASDQQAAFAGAFVLFFLVVALNLLARLLTLRLSRRTRVV